MNIRYIFNWVVLFSLLTACTNSTQQQLDKAESLVLSNPDSALALLETIEPYCLWNDSTQRYTLDSTKRADAKWGLLRTWVAYRLYQPYIDETPLTSAFKYYQNKETSHDKALAYYLHSVVHEDQRRGTPEEWEKNLYDASLIIQETALKDTSRNTQILAAQVYHQYAAKLGERHAFNEALYWDSIAVKKAKEVKDYSKVVHTLLNYSTHLVLFNEEKGQKSPLSFQLINEARRVAIQKGLKTDEGKVYGRMSNFFSRQQQLDSALCYALKAVHIDEQQLAEGKRNDPVRYTHVTEAYFKLGMADSALHYARKDVSSSSLVTRYNASFLLSLIYSKLLHNYEEAMQWERLHESQSDSLHQHDIALATGKLQQDNSRLIHQMEKKQKGLSWGFIVAIIACIVIILMFIRLRHNNNKKLHLLEEEINQLLVKNNNIDHSATSSQADDSVITLEGSTRESITLPINDILCLESDSNYLRVYYVNDGQEVSKLLRMTMTQAESQLQEQSRMMRCHRAFMVNLTQVDRFSSSGGAYTLFIKNSTLRIPISRTYLPRIRKSLNLLHQSKELS